MRVVPSNDIIIGVDPNPDISYFCFLTELGGTVSPVLSEEGNHQAIGYNYTLSSSASTSAAKPMAPAAFVPTVLTAEHVTHEKQPVVAGGQPYIVPPPPPAAAAAAAGASSGGSDTGSGGTGGGTKRPRAAPQPSAEAEAATAAALKAFALADENGDVFKFLRKHAAISRSGESKLARGVPLALRDEDIPLSAAKMARLVELGVLDDD